MIATRKLTPMSPLHLCTANLCVHLALKWSCDAVRSWLLELVLVSKCFFRCIFHCKAIPTELQSKIVDLSGKFALKFNELKTAARRKIHFCLKSIFEVDLISNNNIATKAL